ncbi:type II toxin-antitoxin system Phd/YefM family antitoxin [Yimella sp. cx-51]|uniref:type II toxin-antitoxin system Phd/YefM family antitoxin n=1 Tax=Yimella sp. cx-51 TaxID=2770551 RepID=UPI00165DB383|nr:type II toxin-antitoxin system Phd/YefM family antitoxin [Yimella sp. cx-51]MBC9957386.1 type II toxin-antitoxin system Phd/YefM family antitoxin [Yimella sp. cx-51]QTH39373.1 type II toxin-antitoxin system Phd/YefM family antitoxin [Yimella sp. cx-51]
MVQVNVHEAKTQLSRLIEAALAGERVTIARAGKPVVDLVMHTDGPVVIGAPGWTGTTVDTDALDAYDPELVAAFDGGKG